MDDTVATVAAHEKYGLPIAVTPDGTAMVTGGFDGTVSRWAVRDWTETASRRAHEQSVNCGAVTTADLVVTGSTDTTIRVLDADLSTELGTLIGHEETVAGLAAHPTEPVVASASYDATVRIWHLESNADPVVLAGHPKNVTSVDFVDRGESLVSGGIGDELIVWDLDSRTEAARLGGHGPAVAGIASTGEDELWSVGYNGTVRRWATDAWSVLDTFDLPDDATPSGIAVRADGAQIAVTRDGGVLVFDADGRQIATHTTTIKGIYMPRWAPDGSFLAVGGADGTVRIYGPVAAEGAPRRD